MLKQGTFINKKFNRMILGNIWGWLGYCINLMTDSLISGNQLGEVSLQAVSIVFPLYSVISFFAYMIPPGSSVIFGKRIGGFKQKEAYRVAGTSLLFSIIMGILIAVGLFLIKEPFLAYYECTGELYTEASNYYNWLFLYAIIHTIEIALYYLAITDGEAILTTAAGLSDIIVNIVFSILLSQKFGISGLGMATCMGILCQVICYSLHLLRKSNNVKFCFCLDIKTVGKAITLGFSRYMMYLFMAVVDIVMNKIIITTCGMMYIPVYSVVNLVFGVCELYGSICDASISFVTCFLGEQNNHDIDLIFRKITKSILIMATGITVFFFFGAPLIPTIYGLETPDIINSAIATSRIMSFTALGFGICYLSSEISCCVEKPGQACLLFFLNDVFAPLLLSLILSSLLGFTGIAIGMSLSTYFAFGLYALIRIPRKGKSGFPIYMENFGEEGYSYDLNVTTTSLVELRNAISENLVAHGYEIKNIDLLIEEFFIRVIEKNPGKTVLAECTLLFSKKCVRIIIRDDGALFNFVDENNKIESLNAHVLNSLLEQTKKKNYVMATSFNRNGFVFEK